MRQRPYLAAVTLVALVSIGCTSGVGRTEPGGGVDQPGASSAEATLTIFAAASLASALEEAASAYESAAPGTALTISTDSSAALATQIEQGAPADVFLSADTTNPQRLVDAGLAEGEPIVFAGNELTVITTAGNRAGIASVFDLARPGTRIIAAGDAVPVTHYASLLIEHLGAHADAPPGFVAAYGANIVSKEDNVGAVRAKIELGEGDAAIVYVTDAVASSAVDAIAVPSEANVRASYAAIVIAGSSDPAAARQFLEWLAGAEGHAVLGRFGFLPPTR